MHCACNIDIQTDAILPKDMMQCVQVESNLQDWLGKVYAKIAPDTQRSICPKESIYALFAPRRSGSPCLNTSYS